LVLVARPAGAVAAEAVGVPATVWAANAAISAARASVFVMVGSEA
jgi:hypothetical protein